MMIRHSPVLLILGWATACAVPMHVTRLDQVERPIVHPDSILSLPEEPDRPYETIAYLESSSSEEYGTVRSAALRHAAVLGADAIILITQGADSGPAALVPIGGVLFGLQERHYAWKVIVFTDKP